MLRIILAIVLTLVLTSACTSGQYDREREWALRECEKILDATDRENCFDNTPDYRK